MLCVDHTYLSRQLAQAKVADKAGLVGGAWSPVGEDRSFLALSELSQSMVRTAAAPLMLECLCWNPNEL